MNIEVRLGISDVPCAGEYSVEAIRPEERQSISFQQLTQKWKQILEDAKAHAYPEITVCCPDEATKKLCKQVYNFWYPSGKNECIPDPFWGD